MSVVSSKVRVSIGNSRQALGDAFSLSEDGATIQYLDVLANDLGGEAASLWSVNQDNLQSIADERAIQTMAMEWVTLASGARIAVTADGQVAYDFSMIDTLTVQALGAGDEWTETFTYSIRLGNGTLSSASVSITIVGNNDPATISGDFGGAVSEDGSGDLEFGSPTILLTGDYPSPHGFSLVDINGDGLIDLVGTDLLDDRVSVFIGNGDGSFGTPTYYPVGLGIRLDSLDAADIDGDGKIDAIAVSGSGRQLVFMHGNGDGTFNAPVYQALNGAFTRQFQLGLFDSDAILDMVIQHDDGVRIMLGNGDGSFTEVQHLDTGGQRVGDVALADFDADGNLDVVAAFLDIPEFRIYSGDGTGNFVQTATLAGGADYLGYVETGDINGDSYLDFVASASTSNEISVVLNDGAGGFLPSVQYSSGGDGTSGAALADFDGDGDLDLATSNFFSNTIAILLNDGSGSFGVPDIKAMPTGGGANLEVADLNGDGRQDIVTSNIFSDDMSIFLNLGAGVPGNPVTTGSLTVADPDSGESTFAAVAQDDLQGVYGAFTFEEETGAWTYTLDNDDPDTQALTESDLVSESLTVWSLDGTASGIITVEISGAYDYAILI